MRNNYSVRAHATSSSYAPTLSRCLSVTGRNRFNGKHWQNCGATITKLVKAIAKFSHAHRSDQTRPPKPSDLRNAPNCSVVAGCDRFLLKQVAFTTGMDGWKLSALDS